MYHIWKVWVSSLESKHFQSQNSTPKRPGFELECKDSNWREFFRVIQKVWLAQSPLLDLGGGFRYFIFSPLFWGRFPFWLKFFRWVGSTTNQLSQLSIQLCLATPPPPIDMRGDGWETGIWAIRSYSQPQIHPQMSSTDECGISQKR